MDVVGDLLGSDLDDARPAVALRPARPVPGVHDAPEAGLRAVHHGLLALLAGADVVDGVLAVLAVHVDLEGEHDHGDGQASQRHDEHAAQRVQRDSCGVVGRIIYNGGLLAEMLLLEMHEICKVLVYMYIHSSECQIGCTSSKQAR